MADIRFGKSGNRPDDTLSLLNVVLSKTSGGGLDSNLVVESLDILTGDPARFQKTLDVLNELIRDSKGYDERRSYEAIRSRLQKKRQINASNWLKQNERGALRYNVIDSYKRKSSVSSEVDARKVSVQYGRLKSLGTKKRKAALEQMVADMSVIQDDDRGLSRAVFVPDGYKGTSRQVRSITDPLDQLVSFIRGSTRDSLAEHAVDDTDYYSSKAQEIIDSHSGSRGYATSAGETHGEIVGRISEFNQRLEKADVVRKRDRGNQAKARWRAGQRRDRLHGKIEELEKQVEKNVFGSNEVDNRMVDVDHDYGIDNAWSSYTHQKYELNSVVHEFERARRLGGLQPDDIALYEARIVELQQGLGKQVEYLTDEKNRGALVSFIKNEVLDISTEDEFTPERQRTTVYNDASSAKMEEVIQDLQRRKRATNDPQIAGMIDNQIAMALKFYNQITDEGDRYNLYGSTGRSVTRELNHRAALMWADSANLTGGVSLRVTDRSTEGSSFFRGLTGLVSGVSATDTGQVTFDVSWRGVRALDDAIAPRVDLKSINAIRALDEATDEKEALVRTLKSIGKFTAEKQEEVELIVRGAASRKADFLFYTARRLLNEAMNPESGQLHGKYKETKMNEIIRKIREQSLEHELSELDVVRMIKKTHGGKSGLIDFLNEVSVALSGTPEQLRYLIEQAAEDASTMITGDGSTPLSSASSSKTKSIIGKKINPVVQNMMDTIGEITQGRPSTVQRRLSKESLSIQSLAEVEKLFMRSIREEDRGQARDEFYRLASYFITNDKPEQDAGIQKLWVAIGGARLSQDETLNSALAKVRKSIDDPELADAIKNDFSFQDTQNLSQGKSRLNAALDKLSQRDTGKSSYMNELASRTLGFIDEGEQYETAIEQALSEISVPLSERSEIRVALTSAIATEMNLGVNVDDYREVVDELNAMTSVPLSLDKGLATGQGVQDTIGTFDEVDFDPGISEIEDYRANVPGAVLDTSDDDKKEITRMLSKELEMAALTDDREALKLLDSIHITEENLKDIERMLGDPSAMSKKGYEQHVIGFLHTLAADTGSKSTSTVSRLLQNIGFSIDGYDDFVIKTHKQNMSAATDTTVDQAEFLLVSGRREGTSERVVFAWEVQEDGDGFVYKRIDAERSQEIVMQQIAVSSESVGRVNSITAESIETLNKQIIDSGVSEENLAKVIRKVFPKFSANVESDEVLRKSFLESMVAAETGGELIDQSVSTSRLYTSRADIARSAGTTFHGEQSPMDAVIHAASTLDDIDVVGEEFVETMSPIDEILLGVKKSLDDSTLSDADIEKLKEFQAARKETVVDGFNQIKKVREKAPRLTRMGVGAIAVLAGAAAYRVISGSENRTEEFLQYDHPGSEGVTRVQMNGTGYDAAVPHEISRRAPSGFTMASMFKGYDGVVTIGSNVGSFGASKLNDMIGGTI